MSDHTDGCSYQSCTCKPGPMTEREAAEKLAALLNEIQAAGHMVGVMPGPQRGYYYLSVGENSTVDEPQDDDGDWTVVS